jgi:hypothetical protein
MAPLVVGAVTSLALVAVFLAASWLAGWYEERARRALAAVRRGSALRPGFGAFHGTARPLDGRAGGLLVTTTVTQVRFGGGAWRDSDRTTTGAPFALVLGSGEEVEIDPRDVFVEGGGARPVYTGAFSRDLVARVATGDEVWATGVLSRVPRHAAGAYRSAVARRRLTPRRGGRVEIARTSPLPRWEALARAHKRGAYQAAGLLALIHVAVYRQLDRALILRQDQACAFPVTGYYEDLSVALATMIGAVAIAVTLLAWSHALDKAKRTT